MTDKTHSILKGIFVELYQTGCKEIPIDQESLDSQAKIFDRILNKYGINTGDTFNVTPVSESYYMYIFRLLNVISYYKMGLINFDYDKIVLNCNEYLVEKTKEELKEYQDPIKECAISYLKSQDLDYLIKDEKDVIETKSPQKKKARETNV